MANLSVPIFDVKSPLDLGKINPVGSNVPEIKKAQEEAYKSVEDLTNALEERYAKPNWFKVAAGFAKPQLGGFLASMGSAAEAAGEQVEQQRAIAPTVAKLRAEVAAGKLGLSQRVEQEKAIQNYDKSGKPDITTLRYIYSLDPNSPVAKSIEKRPEFEQARREETGFGLGLQEKLQKNPSLIIGDPTYKGLEVPETTRNQYVNAVNNTVPPGVNPDIWKTMSFTQRQDAHAEAAIKQNTQGLEEGQRAAFDARQSHDVLDKLTTLRTLAVDKDLAPVFSVLNNGDLFSQYRAFLDKYPGNLQAATEGLVNATLNKLGNYTPETRAKFDKLVKDIAELEVRLRGNINNPTDAASILNQQRSPSLANSQAGFVGILDQLGLNAYQTIEYNNIRHKKGLTMSDLMNTNDMIDFRNRTRELSEQLARSNALDTTPIWYYPGRKSQAAPAAAPQAGAPQGGSAMTESEIRAEKERRKGLQ